MRKNQNPEIFKFLVDSHIRTVIKQGFSPGIDDITERLGVSKRAACAELNRRTSLTVAALERVGSETRKNLESALHTPDIEGSIFDCDTNRIVDCLVEQLTDRKNPVGFITICLISHPDPGSKIQAAAIKENAAITGWLENYFTTRRVMPRPRRVANALMAVLHGTYAIVLGIGLDAWESIGDTGSLLRYILTACSKEKTAVPRSPERKGGRERRSRRKSSDPVAARPPGDP